MGAVNLMTHMSSTWIHGYGGVHQLYYICLSGLPEATYPKVVLLFPGGGGGGGGPLFCTATTTLHFFSC